MADEGAVAVCVRVRPLNSREEALGKDTQVYWKTDNNTIYQVDGSKSFNFDRVFHSNETTKNVYEEIAVPIIDSAIQGYNGTIFAYGQTASGKTYTMLGSQDYLGVIPRAIHDIFQKIKKILESREKGEPSNFEGSVKVSHLFASTAKNMKNTPYVNEVSSDEALLKRYRKEIMDLKKQLEEVSLETRAQAMEKDQMAQLLEEKDLLQKVQIEKIQNLTRMLVTSSSLTSQQELKENLESELSSLRANYDNLVLDYEQLRRENEEMELKLKEKNDLDEFEALERKTEKDQEDELSSKVELLREKEDQIKKLQKYIDSQKSGSMEMDLSYSSENTEDLKQMKQTLLDAETVALDAKRESAFLRSENLKLKEKMIHDKSEELCIITSEKDKLFSEVAHKESRIQDLLEEIGKTKNDLATSQLNYESTDQEFRDVKNHHIEFEQKYKMVLEENAKLKQEIGSLSKEAQELGLNLDALKTELSHKTQELQQKTTENQKRLKEVEELKEQLENRDSRLHTVEKEKTLLTEKLQQTLVEVKTLTQEKDDQKQLQESLQIERDQLKNDIQDTINMTIENQEELRILGNELKKQQEIVAQEKSHTIKKEEELSRTCEKLAEVEEKLKEKSQQLQEKQQQLLRVQEEMTEIQKKTNEMENLKNELKNQELTLERIKTERLELVQKLHENYEEMKFITKERNDLKELQESFEIERNKLKGHIREIEATIVTLVFYEYHKIPVLHEEQELLPNVKEVSDIQETVDEPELLKEQSKTKDSKTLASVEMESLRLTEKLQESHEEIKSLTKERDDLKMTKEALQVECDQLKEEIRETLTKIQASQDKQEQSFNMKEKDNETKKIMSEMEQLKEQFKVKDSALLRLEMEKLEWSERLQESHDEVKSIAKERDDLQRLQEVLQSERNQLQENIREMVAKTQELHEKQKQFITIKEISETQEKVSWNELEQLKEHLKAKDSSLQRIESERLKLTEKLQASQDEIKTIIKERDDLERVQEVLQKERDQLKENIKEIVAEGQKIKEELKAAYILLKQYQETINTRNSSEKTDQGANIQRDLEISDAELQAKIQELQEEEHQLLKMKDVSETQEKICEMGNLKKQLEAQKSTLENTELENIRLTQRLHENFEEIRSVTKERDDLRSVEETLKVEIDQLKENLRETTIRDLEKQEELRIAQMNLKEHQETIDKLRGIVSEKTDEISNIQKALENTNTALKAQIQELQEKERQLLKVKNDLRENTYQTEQLKKQLEAQNSTLESIETEKLRLTQKLQENLEEIKSVTKERDDLRRIEGTLKMEQDQLSEILRETKAKDLGKQEELRIAHVHLKEHQEIVDKLRRIVCEKTEEISNMQMDLENSSAKLQEKVQELKANEHQLFKLKEEVSETQKKMCDIERLKKEFKAQSLTLDKIEMENLNLAQKLHENLEEMKSVMKERDNLRRVEETLKLERDLLKADLQEAIARAIMNESTEFEERNATIAKEWEHDLKSMKENNEKLFKNYQTLKISLTSGALVNPTTQDNKNLHVTSRATQQATEKTQELEMSLHEAKESAMHKEGKIIKMQKELEMTNDIIAKLQGQVNESNDCLEKAKEMIQVLQDKVALGAKPYKEEIEELKMKLVKIDLEKMKNAKEFEKEIASTKTTVEYQKEVIRLLRENLRRNQQAQDTSMVSEHADPQPSNKPFTCGGGSGIVQSTKALILKSEYIRLEKEVSKLKQQNEQLIKQKNELLSEVNTWKERTLKREAHKEVTCENSPKSPKVTGTASKKRQHMSSQCKERNLQDPVPKESPKSWFFDSRSKSLPVPPPVHYFDNSSLGLCPEEQIAGAETVDPQPGPWHASSGKDVPECKTQ
ncbi:hypothetical protein J1605_011586 [Eschrichtius robustus]|uniref:Kinesin motor domain-containing protein n=1 Tax=Eschrichtius robustus TaxID=9764 RepID=A0AB34GMS3_ESCRO|nr:hypothetical protein J1605_011586 [Eschrichtius robustus]